MTATELLKSLLSMSVGSLPTILACLVAMGMVLARGQRLGVAVPWALLGFGLILLMSIFGPFSGLLLQQHFSSHALSFEHNAWMFGVLAIVNSSIYAAALIFLLVAVLVQRTLGTIPPSPPPV